MASRKISKYFREKKKIQFFLSVFSYTLDGIRVEIFTLETTYFSSFFSTRSKFLVTKAIRQNSPEHRFSREVKKCEEHRFCLLSSFPKAKLCGTVVETKRQDEYAGLGARVGRIANAECRRAKPVGGDST